VTISRSDGDSVVEAIASSFESARHGGASAAVLHRLPSPRSRGGRDTIPADLVPASV